MKTDRSVYIDNKWIALLIILFAPVISVIDIFIVNVSLPTIQSFYQTSNGHIQLIIASYLIGYCVFMITGSRMGDYFGRKKMLASGIFLFTLFSALCGYSKTINYLIFFRFLQGIAAAIMVPQAITLIQLIFKQGKERDKAFGLYGIALGFASVMGQFLGGFLIHVHWIKESWRLIFLINVPVGVIAAVLVYFILQESRIRNKAKFDISGVMLLTLTLVCMIFPITQGREQNWPIWAIVTLFISFVLLYIFIKDQIKKKLKLKEPLINMNLFKIKNFNFGVLSVFFFYGLHNAFLLCLAILLQDAFSISPYNASLLFTSLGWSFMISSYWSIHNATRYGVKMLQMGSIIIIVSFLIQGVLFQEGGISYGEIILCLVLYGLGSGLVLPSIMKVSLNEVPEALAGTSSGVYSTIQQFSSACGVSVLGGIFFSLYSFTNHNYIISYRVTLVCMTVYSIILIFLLSKIKNNNKGI